MLIGCWAELHDHWGFELQRRGKGDFSEGGGGGGQGVCTHTMQREPAIQGIGRK
jgi:hypothetical protein